MHHNTTTSNIWALAHGSLCAGSWRTALGALDELTYRADVAKVDTLSTLDAYQRAAGSDAGPYAAPIRARLELIAVNQRNPVQRAQR